MDKELPRGVWGIVKIAMLIYGLLCLMQWVNYLFYDVYSRYLYVASLHNIFMGLGLILFFMQVGLLLLKVTHIIKMSGKLSIAMVLLLLSNLLLVYLEIMRQGDS